MMLLKLMRHYQWYKNLLVLLPLIFSKNLTNFSLWPDFIAAFILLSFVSSANYVINDIVDAKNDRRNPEKKDRPIASGKIKKSSASVFAFLLILISLYLSYKLNVIFFLVASSLFISFQIYTLLLNKVGYADIAVLSVNFVLRALSGYSFLPEERISIWLIFCVFLLALLLSAGKRYGEFLYLKRFSVKQRIALLNYNKKQLIFSVKFSAVLFLLALGIFPFYSQYSQRLVYIFPLAIYMVYRYVKLTLSGSIIARHPEKSYKDGKLFIAGIVYLTLAISLIYA